MLLKYAAGAAADRARKIFLAVAAFEDVAELGLVLGHVLDARADGAVGVGRVRERGERRAELGLDLHNHVGDV